MKKNKEKRRDDLIPVIICITAIYVFAVLYITLFDRNIGHRRSMLQPLFEVRQMMRTRNYSYWLGQIGGNLIMLLPLGMLLPAISDFFKDVKRTVAAGFAFSLFIELMQYITGRGLCELDDVFHNTLGTIAGFLIYYKLKNISLNDKKRKFLK